MSSGKDKIVQLPDADDIRMEAASWITVLGRDEVSAEDTAKFKAWRAQSDRHRKAFDSLSALCADLPILKEIDDVAEATVMSLPPETRFLPRRTVFAMAASVAMVLVAGGAYQALQTRSLNQVAEFETEIGKQRTFELADGSTVQLNTASKVEVEYSRTGRTLRLTEGEAFFDVEKDPKRPFSVYAGDGVVTAIGTAFSVRVRDNTALEVTVEEGRVALAKQLTVSTPEASVAPAINSARTAQLSAGQTTVFDETVEEIKQMPAAELERKLAWRDGMLAYSGEPLSEVIADISRYTDLKIDVDDPALLERQVAGYFKAEEVDASISSLALSFGLQLERIGPKHVRLTEAAL